MHNQENQNSNGQIQLPISYWEKSLAERKEELEETISTFFHQDNPFIDMHDLFAAYLEVSEDEKATSRASTCYGYSRILLFFSKLKEIQDRLNHCRENLQTSRVKLN